MDERTAPHLAEETAAGPASFLTCARGDRVYDLYGWGAGRVRESLATGDDQFDGLRLDFRGERLFVDAPEVEHIYSDVVQLGVTNADLARATAAGADQPGPRDPAAPAAHDDAVALTASLSRFFMVDVLSLEEFERAVDRVLRARAAGDLDAIAADVVARWRANAAGSR